MPVRHRFVFIPLALLWTLPAAAQEVFEMAFPGAEVIEERSASYGELRWMTSNVPNFDGRSEVATDAIEGATRTVGYALSADRSPLEVFRVYQGALSEAGFVSLFECETRDECGPGNPDTGLHAAMNPEDPMLNLGNDGRYGVYERISDGQREMVEVATSVQSFPQENRIQVRWGSTGAQVAALERLNADGIAAALAADGTAAIYGLEFETDSAVLRPEADAVLAEMAAYLSGTDANFLLVGHTDDVGALDYNMDLSARRAAAVRTALAERHGIAGGRMEAHGVGFLAPAASNADEAGRARNRRVEMVLC